MHANVVAAQHLLPRSLAQGDEGQTRPEPLGDLLLPIAHKTSRCHYNADTHMHTQYVYARMKRPARSTLKCT